MRTNSGKVILDLCGGTGSWSKYYRENGYKVLNITLPDFSVNEINIYGNAIEFVHQNNLWETETVLLDDIYGILAAPPCTMFSIARNDKTAKEPRDLRGGMEIVQSCLNIIHACLYRNFKKDNTGLKFWALENPSSGYLKRFLGKPALVFDPYEYGDPYLKKTALWGEFNEPKKNIVEPIKYKDSAMKYIGPIKHLKDIPEGYQERTGYDTRNIMRSMTPLGFAEAFYKSNK